LPRNLRLSALSDPFHHGFDGLLDVPRQLGEPARQRARARDDHDVDRPRMPRRPPVRLSEPAPSPISRDGPTDSAGHREPHGAGARFAWPPERDEIAMIDTPTPLPEHELKVGGA